MHDSFFSGTSPGASSNSSESATGAPFGFGNFVPGFDFLQTLVQSASQQAKPAGAVPPGMPDWSKWVAPTLEPKEIDKRIGELKTVQFWLEQNARALAATIQALEVQKMTLATLRGMNVQMEDFAGRFGFGAAAAASAPAPESAATADAGWRNPFAATPPAEASQTPAEPARGPYDDMMTPRHAAADPVEAADSAPDVGQGRDLVEEVRAETHRSQDRSEAAASRDPAAVDEPDRPADSASRHGATGAQVQGDVGRSSEAAAKEAMQWWSALTGQFQQIAASALADAAKQAKSANGVQMTESAMRAFDVAGRMAGSVMAGAENASEKGADSATGRSARGQKSSQSPAGTKTRSAASSAPAAKKAAGVPPARKGRSTRAAPAPSAQEVVWKAPSGARKAVAAKSAAGAPAASKKSSTRSSFKATPSKASANAARSAKKR
jgi:hypothetical protein